MKEADPAQVANRLRGRCGFQVQRPGLQPRPYFLLRRPRRPSSRTVRARLRILNLISYESRNVTINVPTAARAARASKTFDISDTSTVGLNEATIAKYIREQEKADIAIDRLSVKEYEDPFDRGPGRK